MTKDIIFYIITTFIGGFIGYFWGIHKERSNKKWTEKREALRKTYNLIQHMTKYIHSGVPDAEYREIKEKGEEVFYNETSVLPANILEEFNKLTALFLVCVNEKSREAVNQKNLFLQQSQDLSKKIKKELK